MNRTNKTKQPKKEIEQPKEIIPPKKEEHNHYNNGSEVCKVGELYLQSNILTAEYLAELVIGMLEDDVVKQYLKGLDKKKLGGMYYG